MLITLTKIANAQISRTTDERLSIARQERCVLDMASKTSSAHTEKNVSYVYVLAFKIHFGKNRTEFVNTLHRFSEDNSSNTVNLRPNC